jgi:YfiH family protein
MHHSDLDPQNRLLIPDWPTPENVLSLCTTRHSFHAASQLDSGYEAFNLALHVGDDAASVIANRTRLATYSGLTDKQIAWLEQIHETDIVQAEDACMHSTGQVIRADASTTSQTGIACTIMTADCLPVLFCNLPEAGELQNVAAAHAGWRGLAAGILSKTLTQFPKPDRVIAWLGPAISQTYFEVGQEVFDAFIAKDPSNACAFKPSNESDSEAPKWHACLYTLARNELTKAGIKAVYGGQWCTYSQQELFYSFRRDGAASGRMASLIMIRD